MNYFYSKMNLKLLLLFCLFTLQLSLWAQGNVKISINKDRITVKEALKEVEKQSSMPVAYNESKLNGERYIRLNLANQPLDQALKEILANTDFGYQIKDGYIMIVSEKKEQAQKKNITGRILDESGQPLIGATVNVKGTTAATMADIEGNFSIMASKGDVLLFTYLGYETRQMNVGENNRYEVALQPITQDLDAVVVTALGIKRAQKALSYNVQEIKQDDITRVKDANFINALSGKVAGVTINSSSSGVGGASKVVMRGSKSIDQSSNALYVIDGVPMFSAGAEGGKEFDSTGTSEAIADINPEDIESMTVLTGAAAAALYGSQAANGAVVITTKKGKAGRTSLTVSQNTEFLSAFVTPEFQNRYGTGSLLNGNTETEKSWGARLNSSNYMGYSPKDDYLRTGVVTTESVNLSTGTDRNQTYLSTAAVNSKGLVPNNKYERYNFTIRNTTSFLNEKMLLDLGASYIKQKDRNMTNQGTYSNPLVTAYLFPRGDDWNDIKMYERYSTQRKISEQYWPQGINEFTGQNPYWINFRNLRDNNKDRYMMNANLSYQVLDWLSLAGRVRIDNADTEYTEKLYATTNKTLTEGSDNGLYGLQQIKDKQLYSDFLVNINRTFNESFTLQANIGASISDIRQDAWQVRGPIREDGIPNKFTIVQLDYANSKHKEAGWHDQTQSIFASAELGYKGAYYLTLTGRNDWPSQLAGPNSNQSSFFYPSVGTSFVLSEIFPMPKFIEYMKLRASFASVGLPFKRFIANPGREWDGTIYNQMANYPMYNLKPERTDSWEVGLTTRFLKNFSFDLSLYYAKSFNQTFDPDISVSAGYKKIILQTGSVRNQGIELALGYQNSWGNFRWASNYTLSSNGNKILELVSGYVHPETGLIIDKDRLDVGGLSQAHFLLKKGGTLGDLYSLSDLQRDSNGNIYIDQDGKLAVDNKVGDIKLGSVFPKCNMAWRNDFSWKNFNFGFMVSARLGGIVYSATQAALDLYGVSEASAAARDNGGVILNGGDLVSAETWYTTIGGRSGIPQYYTYSATNVRLQEASIGYTFSKNKLWNIGEVTVSVVGRNLWMIYNKAPFDPESTATTGNYYQGIDNFMMPSTRSMGFNVRLKF